LIRSEETRWPSPGRKSRKKRRAPAQKRKGKASVCRKRFVPGFRRCLASSGGGLQGIRTGTAPADVPDLTTGGGAGKKSRGRAKGFSTPKTTKKTRLCLTRLVRALRDDRNRGAAAETPWEGPGFGNVFGIDAEDMSWCSGERHSDVHSKQHKRVFGGKKW